MDQLNRDLGRLEGTVGKIEDDIEGLRSELASTKALVAEVHQAITHARGGWKMLVVVATASSALTTAVGKFAAWLREAGIS